MPKVPKIEKQEMAQGTRCTVQGRKWFFESIEFIGSVELKAGAGHRVRGEE
jgi:hypothetical protein